MWLLSRLGFKLKYVSKRVPKCITPSKPGMSIGLADIYTSIPPQFRLMNIVLIKSCSSLQAYLPEPCRQDRNYVTFAIPHLRSPWKPAAAMDVKMRRRSSMGPGRADRPPRTHPRTNPNRKSTSALPAMDRASMLVMEANEIAACLGKDYVSRYWYGNIILTKHWTHSILTIFCTARDENIVKMMTFSSESKINSLWLESAYQ